MSNMQITEARADSTTTDGHQISQINQQEHVYVEILENLTEVQSTEANWRTNKNLKRCRWSLPLTAVLTALISAALFTSITYLIMKSSTDSDKLNATFDINQQDLKRLLATLETVRQENEQLNSSLFITRQGLEESKRLQVNLKCGHCISPWMLFNCHCYYFSRDTRTWANAQSTCQQRNSNLVKIEDKAENDWLILMLRVMSITDHTWIGANDITQPDHWKWVSDNTSLNFTAWGHNEPSRTDFEDGKIEDCGSFFREKKRTWNDINCNYLFSYICEQ